MTSQLQPLDVSSNKPFKHLHCKHYDTWLGKDNQILTPSGKIKRESTSIIVVGIKGLERGANQHNFKIVFIMSDAEDGK
jgi:hypothetical protein